MSLFLVRVSTLFLSGAQLNVRTEGRTLVVMRTPPSSPERESLVERPVFERTGNNPIVPKTDRRVVSFVQLLNTLNDSVEQNPQE